MNSRSRNSKPSVSVGALLAGVVVAGALAGSVTLLFGSCGRKPTTEPARAHQPPAPHHGFLAASDLGGHWQWAHVEEADGVRRVEDEHWYLDLVADTVTGHYRRVVTFLSLDGVPFECSQALSYQLITDYQVIGTADSENLGLSEIAYQAAPSPCERGFRRLADYTGQLHGDALLLHWPGGSQTLSRTPSPSPPAPPTAASGSWLWHNRNHVSGSSEVRVETEEWALGEGEYGTVTGTYLRTVTVFDSAGHSYPCAGDSHYQYRDRYTVVGARKGRQLVLSETAVAADEHPCLVRTDRHLDAATGTIGDDFISLVWRGRHHQVLHRQK